MIELLLLVLIALISLLLFFTFRRNSPTAVEADKIPAMIIMQQQQVETLRTDLRESLRQITEHVAHQLTQVTQQLQSQTQSVGTRLDHTALLMSDVQKNLGELGRATSEIKELGQSVSKLEELLRAPKLRGGLGEYLLEDMLKQVLPEEHFTMQYRFRSGNIVDAVIHTSDRMATIDSKFPLENFRRMAVAGDDAERRTFLKAFAGDVKRHIDDIATKYILPDEGTFPFAFMYIPAENIYYEVIIKDETANGPGIHDYAIARRVVPVSPNSFYAYLQVIALGLRGLHIEQRARDILTTLERLQGDVTHVRAAFDTLGTHLDNAVKKYDDAGKKLSNFEGKLENVTERRISGEKSDRLVGQDEVLSDAA